MTLDIYFGARVTRGTQNKSNCRRIIDVLSIHGNVLTKHFIMKDVEAFEIEYEKKPGDNAFKRDKRWLRQAKCDFFEVSEPSTDVVRHKVDVIKAKLKDARFSRFVTQNDSPFLEYFCYELVNMKGSIDGGVRKFLTK